MKEKFYSKIWRECLFSDAFLQACQGGAARAFQGDTPKAFQDGAAPRIEGLSADSRTLKPGHIFIALKGERFDGHDFLKEAWQKGASAFVVSDRQKTKKALLGPAGAGQKRPSAFAPKPHILFAPDTLKALQKLASLYHKKMGTKAVAITGSCGKTTAKAFAQTLFAKKAPFAGPKSYNNAVGAPLCLAGPKTKESFLIQEIGTSGPGEIASLTALCDPVISAVTMVGPSHLQGLGSVPLVAKEKQDIYLKSPKALWVFNRDNPWTEAMFRQWGKTHKAVLSFSSQKTAADISLKLIKEGLKSSLVKGHIGGLKIQAEVAFLGQHNLENLMCACSMALGAGIAPKDIAQRLALCRLPAGRLESFVLRDKNVSVLFDAYNANPASMKAFLQHCAKTASPEKTLFVIGDMKELGEQALSYHKALSDEPALLKSRWIAFVGERASLVERSLLQKGFKGQFIKAKACCKGLSSALSQEMKSGDLIALKASRSLRLERLLFDLTGKKIFG